MKSLLVLVMFAACAAIPQDLSGKMFTFPAETNTAHVKLNTLVQDFGAVTVCHRSFTDLRRDHALFSLSTPINPNDFLIFWDNTNKEIEPHVRDRKVELKGQDYKLNMWHSVCTTWDSQTGLVQLWFDGQPSIRKFISSGLKIEGPFMIILGQEQDAHGGGFDMKQCFIGMMSDVHMWDYTLSHCEIQNYVDELNFTPGNVLNWRALEYEISGRVLLENKYLDETFKMEPLILLAMLTLCAATPLDLSDKMFTFPQETSTANVRLIPSRQNLSAVTVCFRSFTDLTRDHSLFSLATPSKDNEFLIFKNSGSEGFHLYARSVFAVVIGHEYKQNMWHSICATWDASSGLVQLWVDGIPSSRKFTGSGTMAEQMIIVLGQDQDSYGGSFDAKQSFVGMISDLHMWDNVLSPCEIQKYTGDSNFPDGNVLNWKAMEFKITGRVQIEEKQSKYSSMCNN
ncbi:unnamed protein product [Menidia menidia]|uniref:(Atlantic silverside) hypothetical protein n=1 Tax=Menidia menidia TaxID=238744 RepID=A0A8S4BRS4_9TELE|nr:unnamed protein product [Menidia menidia]